MGSSRALFEDGLEIIKAAWTQKRVTFPGTESDSRATGNPRGVEVVPKPLQIPHPPIRLAANSAETFTFAGRHGYPIFAGGPVNPIPVLAERLQVYERALKAGGEQRPDGWLRAAFEVVVRAHRAALRGD